MAEKHIYNILVLIDGSWGEIDWILPVCRYIKDNYPQVTISVVLNRHDSEDIIRGNDFLRNLLTQSVDNCYDLSSFLPPLIKRLTDMVKWPSRGSNMATKLVRYARYRILTFIYSHFVKGLEERIIGITRPDVLLKDVANDVGIRRKITLLVRERGGSVVVFPHGTDVLLDVPFPSDYENSSCDGDIILCGNDNMSDLYGRMFKCETAVVGIPKYDSWWAEYIQAYRKQRKYSPKWDSSKQYTVLFVTRGPHPSYLSKESFEYLMRETIRTVLSLPGTFLVVTPHPRYPLAMLEQYLEEYDRSRWTIDSTMLLCLAGSIDLVITMWSSATFDALAMGIPVIEFFRFEGSHYQWSREKDGTLTTGYRKLGLVAPANNGEELLFWINRFRESPDAELERQLTNFRKLVPDSENSATRLAADFVLGKR